MHAIHVMQRMSGAISVRLPEELVEKLDRLAESLNRSKTYIIKRALQEYLEEYEDYFIALHRLNDKDEVVSAKELTAALD
jgi:RHH-type transcriptional regulator, rel operon repressor / antitoxin RelB